MQGAKLFYLSGMINGEYQKTEVHNLGRFISVMKFRPLQWRTTHPYILVDRYCCYANLCIALLPFCSRPVFLFDGTETTLGTDIKRATPFLSEFSGR